MYLSHKHLLLEHQCIDICIDAGTDEPHAFNFVISRLLDHLISPIAFSS